MIATLLCLRINIWFSVVGTKIKVLKFSSFPIPCDVKGGQGIASTSWLLCLAFVFWNHDVFCWSSWFQKIKSTRTVDVFTPAMSICALLYSMVAVFFSQESNPTMLMKTLPDNGP